MPHRTPLASFLVLAALALTALPAHAALNAYLVLKSTKSGDLKSENAQKGREGQIIVTAFNHDVTVAPAARGNTFKILKDLDKTSPVLRGLLGSGDTFSTFELRLWRPMLAAASGTGQEEQYFTIILHGAKLSAISAQMLNNKDPELAKFSIREEVTFSYTSIDYVYTKGAVSGTSTH